MSYDLIADIIDEVENFKPEAIQEARAELARLRAQAAKVEELNQKIMTLQGTIKLLDASLSIPDHPKAQLIMAESEAWRAVRRKATIPPAHIVDLLTEIATQIDRLDQLTLGHLRKLADAEDAAGSTSVGGLAADLDQLGTGPK